LFAQSGRYLRFGVYKSCSGEFVSRSKGFDGLGLDDLPQMVLGDDSMDCGDFTGACFSFGVRNGDLAAACSLGDSGRFSRECGSLSCCCFSRSFRSRSFWRFLALLLILKRLVQDRRVN
jgi:hypothetical protein